MLTKRRSETREQLTGLMVDLDSAALRSALRVVPLAVPLKHLDELVSGDWILLDEVKCLLIFIERPAVFGLIAGVAGAVIGTTTEVEEGAVKVLVAQSLKWEKPQGNLAVIINPEPFTIRDQEWSGETGHDCLC